MMHINILFRLDDMIGISTLTRSMESNIFCGRFGLGPNGSSCITVSCGRCRTKSCLACSMISLLSMVVLPHLSFASVHLLSTTLLQIREAHTPLDKELSCHKSLRIRIFSISFSI